MYRDRERKERQRDGDIEIDIAYYQKQISRPNEKSRRNPNFDAHESQVFIS